jgi:hypothetical protein
MAEAKRTLPHTDQVERRLRATEMTLARWRAVKIAEQQLRSQGVRPQCMASAIIRGMADKYLAEHRAELVAEAVEIVERWRADGLFGKRMEAAQPIQISN